MPAAQNTLILSDGTVTCNLLDGTNYMVPPDGWAPQIAALRQSMLGGRSPYDDVTEEITVHLRGSSPAAILQNFANLKLLVDRAAQFDRGEIATPVILSCQPAGSLLSAPLQAVVIGGSVTSPKNALDMVTRNIVPGVTLRLIRRGLWLGSEEDSGASAAAANPSVLTRTLTNTSVLSPTRIEIGGFTPSGGVRSGIVMGGSGNVLTLLEGESLTSVRGTFGANVADTTNNARGGSVRRLTGNTSGYVDLYADVAGLTAVRSVRMMLGVRNNVAGVGWTVKVTYLRFGSILTTTPPVPLITTTTPQVVPIPEARTPNGIDELHLEFQATGGTNPTIDLDYLALLDTTQPGTFMVTLPAAVDLSERSGTTFSLVLDPRVLTNATPGVTTESTIEADVAVPSYLGDPAVYTTGTTISAVWLATDGTNWRQMNGAAVLTNTLRVKRRPAYLIPQ